MQFLEVSLGVAVGIIAGFLVIGLALRKDKKPDRTEESLEALQRRNSLTEVTNQHLADILSEIAKR